MQGIRYPGAATLLASVLLACASSSEPSNRSLPEPAIVVSGRVVVVGSDPHVLLVIVTDAGDEYELTGEPAAALWRLQQRRVTVHGRLVRQAYGPGLPAQLEVDEYSLLRAGAGPAER